MRGGTRDGRPLGDGITPWRLDVTDPASLPAALHGVDAVVHCAYGGRAATVGGTRLLLEAACRAGVRRVVHLSSIAVYGAATGAVTEAAPLVPTEGRGYAHWKAAAERECRTLTGLEIAILRPAIVYGPGSEQWIEQPRRRLLSCDWGELGALGRGTANPVHVTDVAAACIAALDLPGAAGEAFNIAGCETLSWRDWYQRLGDGLGVGPLRQVSEAAWRGRAIVGLPLRAIARAIPATAPMLRSRILRSPSPSELQLFGLAATYPANKAALLLGWRPTVSLETGLRDALGASTGRASPQ